MLKAAAFLVTESAELTIYEGLDQLPHFNPDNERGNDAVRTLKLAIANSHGVLICTPEYAFGVPGSLKNALDWTVHTGDLNEKPVAVISCSPLADGAKRSMASLLLTMQALGTKTQSNWTMCVGDVYKKLDASTKISDPETETQIKELLTDFVLYIQKHKT